MPQQIENICLLIGQEELPDWFIDAIQKLLEKDDVIVSLVVVAENIKSLGDEKKAKQRSMLDQIKRRLITPSFLNRSPVEHRSIQELELSTAERVETDLEPAEGIGVEIPEEIIELITKSCDVVIHNGVGILKGDILSRPQHGVLSYHHGDIREYRGGAPTGFWQHLNEDEYAGVTLQRLTDQLDAGEVVDIAEVFIRDADTWYEVQQRMYEASVPMLKNGIERLEDPDSEVMTIPESELGEMYYRSDWTMKARLQSRLKDLTNTYFP